MFNKLVNLNITQLVQIYILPSEMKSSNKRKVKVTSKTWETMKMERKINGI